LQRGAGRDQLLDGRQLYIPPTTTRFPGPGLTRPPVNDS
jgi:hypothetical protein